jgi:hypothetical protein
MSEDSYTKATDQACSLSSGLSMVPSDANLAKLMLEVFFTSI